MTGVPNAPGFKAWRQLLNSKVSSASVTPEFAFQLIKKVKKGCKFEDFKDSEGFETLDIKLAAALKGIVPKQLGRQIALKEE